MGAPSDFTDGVAVAGKDGEGALVRGTDIESADLAVDAGGGDDGGAVFVPIVGESFGRGDLLQGVGLWLAWGGVDGDGEG